MGLFRNKEDDKKKLKSSIKKLMNAYAKEEIDGSTYMQKMMDLTTSYQKKHKMK